MTRILLIGAGAIAGEYVKALQALGERDIAVLSRRQESADALAKAYGLGRALGGGEAVLATCMNEYDAFIVATPIETLPGYAAQLSGAKRVLLEKPCFLSSGQLKKFLKDYPDCKANVALNRLYYPSVVALAETLAEEPATSADFSFTEWIHRIDTTQYVPEVLKRWGLSNCIHVIATVFDLIGLPAECTAYRSGENVIAWHPSASVFTGSGMSERRVPFSYLSDWQSNGRWSITVRNAKGAYHLCPMEGLDFTPRGSVEKQTLMPAWQGATKCGFEPMLALWLSGKGMTLSQLLPHIEAIEQIFGYGADA